MYKSVLKQYWGYPDFRPLQEDIIRSVSDLGKDTLGLLPTGGGKSIIFQVPALAKKGVCIVVSPLIALMKDQVENLKAKKIPAAAIYSGMSNEEINITINAAISEEIKFLYLSPERLGTELFLNNIKKINVNLLAIDESHCISQWGYDFRPSYLKIADIRPQLPTVPVLALTATATPEVVDDIQEKLQFKANNVFRKSFERKNLVYIVQKNNDKYGQLLKLAKNIQGTGIVYVRSRRLTEKIASFLVSHNISADYYHAGLTPQDKDKKQNNWKKDLTRIIVSTNAFGMGIDKPDVRFVIHIDLPDSLEAYFQEAGRGGRDEKDAYAFLVHNEEDIINLKQSVQKSYPPKETIFSVYQGICNYLNLPVGSGKGQSFEFILSKFAETFNFKPLEVYNSLKFIQKQGYIEYTEEIFISSRLKFKVSRDELYKFQVENSQFDAFIKYLLRSYPGLFTKYVNVNEYKISRVTKTEVRIIFKLLSKLHQLDILDYLPQKNTPFLNFLEDRIHPKSFIISKENYDLLRKNYKKKVDAVIHYVTETHKCRSSLLLEYFGEYETNSCGRCDFCHKKITHEEQEVLTKQIFELLLKKELSIKEICEILAKKEELVKPILKKLFDDNVILLTEKRKLRVKS